MVREVQEGPFVGEETVVIFLEGGKVVEVVLKAMVMVEMEGVTVVVVVFGRKGLPRAGVFPGTFFLRPLPHCPSSVLNWCRSPFLLYGLLFFSFSSFWMLEMLWLLMVLVLLMSLGLLVLLMTLVWFWVPVLLILLT